MCKQDKDVNIPRKAANVSGEASRRDARTDVTSRHPRIYTSLSGIKEHSAMYSRDDYDVYLVCKEGTNDSQKDKMKRL